jgi:hypothetical protein
MIGRQFSLLSVHPPTMNPACEAGYAHRRVDAEDALIAALKSRRSARKR